MGLSLSELPVEVLLYVFAEAEPSDLGRLAQVSKAFNRLIRGNQLLYKQQYLQYWVGSVALGGWQIWHQVTTSMPRQTVWVSFDRPIYMSLSLRFCF